MLNLKLKIMSKEKTEVVSITMPKDLRDKAQQMSRELYGRINLSGYMTYLVNKEIRSKEKEKV